jgi:hypothetical protein
MSTFSFVLAEADSPKVTGNWAVEITFANDQHRFLSFEAQNDGKGSLTVTDPKSKVWAGAKPSEAKWTPVEGNSVTFSGPAEFLIGNVGRDAGTLTFNGKFETPDLITIEAWNVQSCSRKKIARARRLFRREARGRRSALLLISTP